MRLDPLTLAFLPPLLLAALGQRLDRRGAASAIAMLGVVLAGNVPWLLSFASCALALGLLAGHPATPTPGRGWPVVAWLSLAASLALLLPPRAGLFVPFAELRATSLAAGGWRPPASVLLALPLLLPGFATPMLGLLPLYVLARLVFELAGAGSALVAGAIGLAAVFLCVGGAAAALRGSDVDAVAAGLRRHASGLALAGLAVGGLGRSLDLPEVAGYGLAAFWLATCAGAVGGALLGAVGAGVARGAGTLRLDCLGGLIRTMPRTSVCALAGLGAFAILPPGAGFASGWLVLQAIMGAARAASAPEQAAIAVGLGGLGLGMALATAAALRLFGVAFLGRPRIPRAAAAAEPARPCPRMVALAAAAGLLGVVPSGALVFIRPALLAYAGVPAARLLTLLPLAVAGVAALGYGVYRLVNIGRAPAREDPAWEGGFAPPPPWLPFGDPHTQIGGDLALWILDAPWPRPAPRAPARRLRRALRVRGAPDRAWGWVALAAALAAALWAAGQTAP